MRRVWSDLGRLGLACAGAVLGLVCAELGLRLWNGAVGFEFFLARVPELYETSIFEPDPEMVVALVPGSQARIETAEFRSDVRVNEDGMRSPELRPREEGEFRVLVLGDSFTLGLQVDERHRFTERLEDGLAERLGRPVSIWNAGVDGHGTRHQLANLRRLASRVQPDLVLTVFFTGNDFVDNMTYAEAVRRVSHEPRSRPVTAGGRHGLWRRSVLMMYGRTLWRALDVAGAGEGARHHAELAIFADEEALVRQGGATVTALKDLAGFCAEWSYECAVAVAGPAFVVHPERVGPTFWLFGHPRDSVDVDAPARFIGEVAPEGIEVLDLSGALREAASRDPAPLYFRMDGHWTERGHAVVADALADWFSAFPAPSGRMTP